MIRVPELIRRKREGEELGSEEIFELILAHARDEIPDYQLAAFLMAVLFRGLSRAETAALTDAMVASGATVDLTGLGRPAVDKHSTGGVGDKTSIALGPLVAACGAPFAKMSGRGLGHTGGTLDKLEAIPGFTVTLARSDFVSQVSDIGVAIVGQTPDLVPADARLYALRDVTATVENTSLIAASIMSKKIAAGASTILLDVKVGAGAFMRTVENARELAETMLDLGIRAGRSVACALTTMEQPLGRAVGNALEIREVIDTLSGKGPPDLIELVLSCAAHLLAMSGLAASVKEGRERALAAVSSGEALRLYETWIARQGGDPSPDVLPEAPVRRLVAAPAGGYVASLDALAIGEASVRLGAGRLAKDDPIDHATGIVCLRKHGDSVELGEPLAEVHARDKSAAEEAQRAVACAYRLQDDRPAPQPLTLQVLSG